MPTFFIKKVFEYCSLLTIVLLVFVISFSNPQKLLAQDPDTTPPTTTYTMTPSSPDGNNDWYVSSVKFDLEATDLESGVKEIYYKIDNGSWQMASFLNTGNLAPNPSFENLDASTTTGMEGWEITVADPEGFYSQETTEYAPGYASASARIETTGGVWHGINHKNQAIPVILFDNMSASVWVKIVNVPGTSRFRVYGIKGNGSEVEIADSKEGSKFHSVKKF